MSSDKHEDDQGLEPDVSVPDPGAPSPHEEELPAPFTSVEGTPVADVPAPAHSPEEAEALAQADTAPGSVEHDWMASSPEGAEPEPEPETEPAAEPDPAAVAETPEPTPTVPLAAATPAQPAGTAWTAPPASSAMPFPSDSGASALPSDRPEVAVGLAFAGGALAALILKRLGRR